MVYVDPSGLSVHFDILTVRLLILKHHSHCYFAKEKKNTCSSMASPHCMSVVTVTGR